MACAISRGHEGASRSYTPDRREGCRGLSWFAWTLDRARRRWVDGNSLETFIFRQPCREVAYPLPLSPSLFPSIDSHCASCDYGGRSRLYTNHTTATQRPAVWARDCARVCSLFTWPNRLACFIVLQPTLFNHGSFTHLFICKKNNGRYVVVSIVSERMRISDRTIEPEARFLTKGFWM